jgi:hypothetical protein
VTTPMVLVAAWRDGLFVVASDTFDPELRDQPSEPSHQMGVAALSRL